jgi:hypothetical protein
MTFDSLFSFSNDIADDAQGIGRSLGDKIPGAHTEAKILREESHEAVAIMGFINKFMGEMQKTSQVHNKAFNDPKTTASMAESSMKEGSKIVDNDPNIEKPSQNIKNKANQHN